MDELYLDNIDEYVNDHNKIVTYKWLSLTLGVHVNTAKQMLYHYLDHKRKESSAPLHATYLVSGKFVDNGQTSHKVSVVKEDQLEDFKSKMNVIVSVHVYSVQKALLKDSGPLYSVDYDAVKDNLKNCSRYSSISCSSAVPMSTQDLQKGREIKRPPTPEPEHKNPVVNGNGTGNANGSSKPPTKPQKGIMGMFANKTATKSRDRDVKTEENEDASVVDVPKTKSATKAEHMANFFGTQAAKKAEKNVKVEERAEPSSSSSSSKEQKRQSPQPQEKQLAAAVEPKVLKKDSRSKTKRVVDSDSEEEKLEKKKRRRIKKPEPDSSDEDVIPDSPPPTGAREQSPKKEVEALSVAHHHENPGTKIRRRRRVLKSRTFVDDEGCIVTEKGYESESYSETEAEAQAAPPASKDPFSTKLPAGNKQEEKKSQKKSSANASKGAKQASIMGFFQKK
ncbi:DNA polymerase delta subunit 3 isoform X2 [Antennarius striatus]|uniref:DNA polymerase delta subunit 3 isoform X2 n=1 Tax=Antennarius striatus TaxID=241820 RepID=UPI0035AE532E